MKRIFWILIPFLIINCTQDAFVEYGINDEGLILSLFGDLSFQVIEIEAVTGNEYVTVWQGSKDVLVAIQNSDFVSISDAYEGIAPGDYQYLRVTVDGLRYVQDNNSQVVIDTNCRFIATGFLEYFVEAGEEYRFVININSNNWFDLDSIDIKAGHEPFEGARLRVEQQY